MHDFRFISKQYFTKKTKASSDKYYVKQWVMCQIKQDLNGNRAKPETFYSFNLE